MQFFDKNYGNATFCSEEKGILNVDLNEITLNDVNFYENDPETMIHVRLMVYCNRLKQR